MAPAITLVASPGIGALVGDGAWLFPGVVALMLVLAVLSLRARGLVIRVVAIVCGLSGVGCPAGDDGTGATAAATTAGDASEASTAGSDSSASAGSGDTTATTDATTGPIACGQDPAPPGGECPPECNGGCDAEVCTIQCSGAETCIDDTFVCPAELACRVQCMGFDTCRGGTVVCPAMHACEVECLGSGSCPQQIECGTASCRLTCGTFDPCTDTTLACGTGACTATCAGDADQVLPMVECGAACECQAC